MVKLNGLLICVSKEEVCMVIELLPAHIELTHQEEGCISFEVKQSLDPFIWEVQEVFDSLCCHGVVRFAVIHTIIRAFA